MNSIVTYIENIKEFLDKLLEIMILARVVNTIKVKFLT